MELVKHIHRQKRLANTALIQRDVTGVKLIKKTYPAESDAYVTDSPSHQAPIHRGSVGVILGSIDRSAYRLVQSEPNMKPRAGPRILTPMVIAVTQKSDRYNTEK
jgi:hypothetical protein